MIIFEDREVSEAGLARNRAFAHALRTRENWTPEQLEAEEARLAEEAQAMIDAGRVKVIPPTGQNPDAIGLFARREMKSVLAAVGVF